MKIGPQDKAGLPISSELAAAAARTEPRPVSDGRASLIRAGSVASALAAATSGTSVSLSAAASAASGAVSGSADVDMEKVRQVQAALAQGTYRVNPEAIADELIASAQSFLPRRTGG